jgi:Tfp pilus assembly protein PilO
MSLKIKTNIAAVLILSLSLFLFFFLVQPCLTQAIKNGESLAAIRQNSAALEVQIKSLQNFRPRYENEIIPMLQANEKLFIDPKSPVAFIALMEEAGSKDNLAINISSAQIFSAKNSAERFWPSLNFQISLNGSLPSVLRFIEKMANLPYLIEIHGLNITKDNSQSQNEIKADSGQENKKTAGLPQKEKVQAVFNLKIYTK